MFRHTCWVPSGRNFQFQFCALYNQRRVSILVGQRVISRHWEWMPSFICWSWRILNIEIHFHRKKTAGCACDMGSFCLTTLFCTFEMPILYFWNASKMTAICFIHLQAILVCFLSLHIFLVRKIFTCGVLFRSGLPPEGQVNQPLLVSTCHVHWDPEFSDVKLIQTMMLMSELKNILDETQTSLRPGSTTTPDVNNIPMILCGDLNSLPNSGASTSLSCWLTPYTAVPKSTQWGHKHPSLDRKENLCPKNTITRSLAQLQRPLWKFLCSCPVIQITSTWLHIPFANSTLLTLSGGINC